MSDERSTEQVRDADPTEDDCTRAAREWLETMWCGYRDGPEGGSGACFDDDDVSSLAALMRGREAAARAEEREQAAQTLEALGRPDFLDDVAAAGFFHARRTGVAAIRSRAAQEKPQ